MQTLYHGSRVVVEQPEIRIQKFHDGEISRAAFWELAKFKYPTHQISFHSAKALAALKFERSYAANV